MARTREEQVRSEFLVDGERFIFAEDLTEGKLTQHLIEAEQRGYGGGVCQSLSALWKSIDLAPKDGSRVFVHCGEFCTIAWWDNDMDDGNGAWTDGLVADWGMQEMREILPVWFIPLFIFEGSK
ncbi:hypothetical protein [Acetobacter sicerae]|uniref:hypothetical protein n=1 Tax=Acetobacter sicerae TaxID=85325 RepID=UPI00156BD021|nr:hypothetical protein [Acetobacter sicerae]NHN93860.1 hypothetical protein [Acetobacter sicerae]